MSKDVQTVSGFSAYEVVSALQKSIRRAELDNALFWAAEMDLSGLTPWLWKRLIIICSEDVGPAWREGPATIAALHESWDRWKHQPGNACLFIAHAVVLLASSPKTRVVDTAASVHWGDHESLRREIPDEALDKHTIRGRKMGRGLSHFFLAGAVVEPESEEWRPLREMYQEAEEEIARRRKRSDPEPDPAPDQGSFPLKDADGPPSG